jgi:hypothetical protein
MGKGSGSIYGIPPRIKTNNQNFGEKTMKLTIKLFLLVTLFCGTVMADGDMGSGGRTGDMGSGGLTGDMGSGGVVASTEKPGTKTSEEIVVLFAKYIFKILV